MRYVISAYGTRLFFLIIGVSRARGYGGGELMGDMDKGDGCKLQENHYTIHVTAVRRGRAYPVVV